MIARSLPLADYSDGIRPFDFHLIFGLMHYPLDQCAAEDYATANYRWHSARLNSPGLPEPRTLALFGRDMLLRYGRASISGLVLLEFAYLRREPGVSASIRKAVHIACELSLSQPSDGKKRSDYPSDEGDIQKHFREFRPCAHFWAAYMATGGDPETISSDVVAYRRFLTFAGLFAEELVQTKPRQSKLGVAPFYWSAPHVETQDKLVFRRDPETLRILSEYRPVEERGDT